MKVYRIKTNVNQFQYFLTSREQDVLKLKMNCSSKKDGWTPPEVFIYKPKNKLGDFYHFNSDIIITNTRATEALQEHLEMAGELLPLPYNGRAFTLLNVTNCINCLDQERTQWMLNNNTGERLIPIKYVFHRDRFTSARIFKIPETCGGEILVVDMDQGGEEELYSAVQLAKLQGLIFEKIWDEQEL